MTKTEQTQKKTTLYNIADGKTREVVRFIDGLEPTEAMDFKEIKKFDSIKDKAILECNLNKKLDIVGYVPDKRPMIYGWVL